MIAAQNEEKRQLAVLKEAARWLAKIDAKERLGGPKTQAGKRISSQKLAQAWRHLERRREAF